MRWMMAAALMMGAMPAAANMQGPFGYVCADGGRAQFGFDRVTGAATLARGAEERTLFRLVEPGAPAGGGVRYGANQLTVTDLGDEIAVLQRGRPAYRCWRAPAAPTAGVIAGTAALPAGFAAPAGARLTVTLADVSLQDAPRREIASVKLSPAGAPPFHWLVRYDPAAAPPRPATYAVSARLEAADGALLAITDTRRHVLESTATEGPVELTLVAVGAPR